MSKKSEEEEPSREVLDSFFIQSKVSAFANHYEPCDDEFEADEVFNDMSLRQYFNAYPRTCGDPLSLYIDGALASLGFRMTHCESSHEPVILVRIKR